MEESFIKNNEEFLQNFIELPSYPARNLPGPGRPSKSFQELSDRSKRRKTKDLRLQTNTKELVFATQMSLRSSGKADASKMLQEITTTSPKRATRYRKALKSLKSVQQLSPEEALSIFVEADLTRRQYVIIQSTDKSRFPCYSILQKAKQQCYPKPEAFKVTSTCAELNLQLLLDHTSERLCKYLSDVLQMLSAEERENLQLISKWGCDGAQQSQYKQKFENDSDSDANIFQSSFVPLQLITNFDNKKKVIWQNPTPSSPRYCRPIRIRFIRETVDVTKEEIAHIENQISLLQDSIVNSTLHIKHIFLFTMIDGKVCNSATDTKSTQKCYICGATSKDFNNLTKIHNKPINQEALQFGLSILHARIRFFESVLHLAYKIPLKKWQARSDSEKKIVKETKARVQQSFKTEMGLLVDYPKVGFGNTNDGNTSRRFFCEPERGAEITGVSCELLKRYKVILETISCGQRIDVEKFAKYASETATLYTALYPWYPMPPTIHKVLMHGAVVISSAILPIGQLSEEAAEARNKYFKLYRLGFSRKFSRENCNTDIINRLLIKSDPYITGSRPPPKKKTKPFCTETLAMLLPPELPQRRERSTPTTQDTSDDDDELSISDEEQSD